MIGRFIARFVVTFMVTCCLFVMTALIMGFINYLLN